MKGQVPISRNVAPLPSGSARTFQRSHVLPITFIGDHRHGGFACKSLIMAY